MSSYSKHADEPGTTIDGVELHVNEPRVYKTEGRSPPPAAGDPARCTPALWTGADCWREGRDVKTFNVSRHPTLGFEAVKVGFSWPALFIGPLWMLVKKLWGLATGWIAMYLALSLVETVTDK